MDAFNHLAVLISIVLGLGITQLLSGFGRWLEERATFRAYAPSILWAAILLVMHVQTWWSMFGMRHHAHWTFLQFGVVLLQPILLFLLATLVLPSQGAAQRDLRAGYFTQRRWFFGLLVLLLVVSVLKDVVLSGALPGRTNLAFHAVFAIPAVAAAVVERERFHQVVAYVSGALVAAYIFLLFAELR